MYTGTACLCTYQHEHLAVYRDTHALHTMVAAAFSWDGMTDQTGYPPSGKGNPYLANGTTPVFQEWDLPGGNATAAAGVITSRAPKPDNESHFQVYRTVLQVGAARQCDASTPRRSSTRTLNIELPCPPQTAAYHADIVQDLKKNPAMAAQLRVVEPLVLGYLARVALGGNNNDRVTYELQRPYTLHYITSCSLVPLPCAPSAMSTTACREALPPVNPWMASPLSCATMVGTTFTWGRCLPRPRPHLLWCFALALWPLAAWRQTCFRCAQLQHPALWRQVRA